MLSNHVLYCNPKPGSHPPILLLRSGRMLQIFTIVHVVILPEACVNCSANHVVHGVGPAL